MRRAEDERGEIKEMLTCFEFKRETKSEVSYNLLGLL